MKLDIYGGKKPLITHDEGYIQDIVSEIDSDDIRSLIGKEKLIKTIGDYQVTNSEYDGWRILYREDDKIIGAIQGIIMSDGTSVASNIYVRPEYRRHGIGNSLIDFAKKEFKDLKSGDEFTKEGARLNKIGESTKRNIKMKLNEEQAYKIKFTMYKNPTTEELGSLFKDNTEGTIFIGIENPTNIYYWAKKEKQIIRNVFQKLSTGDNENIPKSKKDENSGKMLYYFEENKDLVFELYLEGALVNHSISLEIPMDIKFDDKLLKIYNLAKSRIDSDFKDVEIDKRDEGKEKITSVILSHDLQDQLQTKESYAGGFLKQLINELYTGDVR